MNGAARRPIARDRQGVRWTVAIIGGGPAGSSAALELRHRGIDTLVLERSAGGGNPVGECLAPSINPLVQTLGLGDLLATSGALPSHGNRSAWGGDGAPADRDFLREPLGHGWHLDRPAFNAALLERVEAAGGAVWRQARVTSATRGSAGWAVAVAAPDGTRTLTAQGVIDASGRAAVLARRQAMPRRDFDTQAATLAILEQEPGAPPFRDATTIIEATEQGWWYAALLPDGRLAVAWFTDPDLLAAGGAWRPTGWWNLLRGSALTWNLAAGHRYGAPREIRVAAAGSSLLNQPVGEGWIAAGDAAAAFDPLSSHGIGSALAGGKQAASALAAALDGDATALPAYAARLQTSYARYLWMRNAYYGDEQRWPDAPFWARRHAGFGASTRHTAEAAFWSGC